MYMYRENVMCNMYGTMHKKFYSSAINLAGWDMNFTIIGRSRESLYLCNQKQSDIVKFTSDHHEAIQLIDELPVPLLAKS